MRPRIIIVRIEYLLNLQSVQDVGHIDYTVGWAVIDVDGRVVIFGADPRGGTVVG